MADRRVYELAEPRYEIREVGTDKLLGEFYWWENVPPELNYQRRLGREVYVIDREQP